MQTDREGVPVSPPIVHRKLRVPISAINRIMERFIYTQRIMKICSSVTMERDEDSMISSIAIID
jgi:hypothetical protein